MACHVRVAEPTASFGQPEVRLNLLPGYGGTQRLPRLLEQAAQVTFEVQQQLFPLLQNSFYGSGWQAL